MDDFLRVCRYVGLGLEGFEMMSGLGADSPLFQVADAGSLGGGMASRS